VSVLTPVFNTDPQVLRDTIESILHQSYWNWELCLVDDASIQPATQDVLAHYGWFDPRVRVRRREVTGGISAASNDALSMATGDWVALLDHDDLLDPDALAALVHAASSRPDVQVVYSDEDKVTMDGQHFDPFYKPGWSPERLLSQMYLGHLTMYRKDRVLRVGGFREGYEGSQDWDLALRVTEGLRADQITHVPRTLYHWRFVPGSTAGAADAKPYALDAGTRAVTDALVRRGINGTVERTGLAGWLRVRRTLAHEPLVSVVIPTAGGSRVVGGQEVRLIDRCLHSLLKETDYPNIEVICVLSHNADEDLGVQLRALDPRIRVLPSDHPFDFSLACNRGAAHVNGKLLLLLNDDIEAVAPSWLCRMVEALADPEIGIVGPKLLFEDDTIQHAGVVHQDETPFHLVRGAVDGPGYFGELAVNCNYLAVTGACLLTRTELFERVGGLSLRFPMNYNDIDYCLKVHEEGLRTVWLADAVLHHYESSTRQPTVTIREIEEFKQRWSDLVRWDPFYTLARRGAGV
jgi:GT2 family glycosyltransferase